MELDPVEALSQLILEGPTSRAVQALDRGKVRMAVLQSRAQPREHAVYGPLLTPSDFFENRYGFTVLVPRISLFPAHLIFIWCKLLRAGSAAESAT